MKCAPHANINFWDHLSFLEIFWCSIHRMFNIWFSFVQKVESQNHVVYNISQIMPSNSKTRGWLVESPHLVRLAYDGYVLYCTHKLKWGVCIYRLARVIWKNLHSRMKIQITLPTALTLIRANFFVHSIFFTFFLQLGRSMVGTEGEGRGRYPYLIVVCR